MTLKNLFLNKMTAEICGNNTAIIQPVSYTHLDVYKRQGQLRDESVKFVDICIGQGDSCRFNEFGLYIAS